MGHSISYPQGGPHEDVEDEDDERMFASVFTGEEDEAEAVERKRRHRAGGKPSWCKPSHQEHYGNQKPWK